MAAVTADAPATSDVERLAAIVGALSFGRKDVVLASGRPSHFYFDMKPSMLNPEGAFLVTKLLFARCRAAGAAFVGGLEMGAVPITGGIVAYSHQRGEPIAGFFVRKAAKEHGARKLIEGLAPGASLAGKRVVVVEDVTTTGGSAQKVVAALREMGAAIDTVLTIVDREEGAVETFAAEGIALVPLLKASRFLG